jgi:hypothetical protein
MARRESLAIVGTLTVLSLAACSAKSVSPIPTPTRSLSPSAQPTRSPTSNLMPSPTPTSTSGPFSESLAWRGAASGTLTEAYGTCHLQYVNQIDLHAADFSADFSLPAHAPGIVAQSLLSPGASLHLSPGVGVHRYTLFLATSGSVTYSPDGVSGSVDAWLAPQSNVPTSPSIHITGRWRCE